MSSSCSGPTVNFLKCDNSLVQTSLERIYELLYESFLIPMIMLDVMPPYPLSSISHKDQHSSATTFSSSHISVFHSNKELFFFKILYLQLGTQGHTPTIKTLLSIQLNQQSRSDQPDPQMTYLPSLSQKSDHLQPRPIKQKS